MLLGICGQFTVSATWLSFDAFEVHGCSRINKRTGRAEPRYDDPGVLEPTTGDDIPVCWSVFGHLRTGGLDDLMDFSTEEEALIMKLKCECRLEYCQVWKES